MAHDASLTWDDERPAVITDGAIDVVEGALVRDSIRTPGRLRIGARARLERSAGSGDSAEVGDGARIDGALLVTGQVRWGVGASVGRAAIGGALISPDGTVRASAVFAVHGIHPAEESR